MNYQLKTVLACAVLSLVALQSCKDDDDTPEKDGLAYTVPSSYSEFTNVDYSGQTQRISQLLEMKTYLSTANTLGTPLSEERLIAMFQNDKDVAQWIGAYDDSKQIRDKTFANVQADFDELLVSIAEDSKSDVAHSQGTAGVLAYDDNSKAYLLNENGVEELQIFEKGLLGAFLAYQINEVYLGTDKMSADNEVVVDGEGTAMEHHWDEAFGYFGVPKTFPATTDNLAFWGVYSDRRDVLLGCNAKLMNAFLKGRAAISNKDLATRDQAILEIKKELERVSAATTINYINSALRNPEDIARKGHALGEAFGFAYALQFNSDKVITDVQFDEILSLIGGGTKAFGGLDFYKVSIDDMQAVKDKLAAIYGMENIKDQL